MYDILPLDEWSTCCFIKIVLGPCKPTESDLSHTSFLVWHNYVAKALDWLQLNHSDYADIKISKKNLDEYSEHEISVSVKYMPS